MLVTGRFGLKSYSLDDPAHPVLLDEVTAEDCACRATRPSTSARTRRRVDVLAERGHGRRPKAQARAAVARPARVRGLDVREPGEADPNGATNIAGVYVIDAKDPRDPRLLSFQQLPTGHTTTCVNDCRWLWTGGPASTTTQRDVRGWTFGRPIIVTDLSNPKKPRAFPMEPVDLFRRDGVTAYSHDVQVDAAGIAWVSGDGGTRGYWTDGRHFDPVEGRDRQATRAEADPVRGRRAPGVGHRR